MGDECDLGPLMKFAIAHAAAETVGSFFSIPSIGWCDKQCILNLVMALLSSQINILTKLNKWRPVMGFFGKKKLFAYGY